MPERPRDLIRKQCALDKVVAHEPRTPEWMKILIPSAFCLLLRRTLRELPSALFSSQQYINYQTVQLELRIQFLQTE